MIRIPNSIRALPLIAILPLASCQSADAPASRAFLPWIDGTIADEPPFQVQSFDADTFVIRQSLRTNAEGPFLYLLFGQERALLLDTGAGGPALRPIVDQIMTDWRRANQRESLPLIVAHTHGHGDHIAGDAEFDQRPDTSIVGTTPAQVCSYFGFTDWPREIRSFDLGDRMLTILPTPGHHPSHIAIYDARTRILFSGDMLYAGRIYIPSNHFADYRASVARLATFSTDHPVALILGGHIEMTATPGKDFKLGAAQHPHEHPLELPPQSLLLLEQCIQSMGDELTRKATDDFIVVPIPPRPADPPGFEPESVSRPLHTVSGQ